MAIQVINTNPYTWVVLNSEQIAARAPGVFVPPVFARNNSPVSQPPVAAESNTAVVAKDIYQNQANENGVATPVYTGTLNLLPAGDNAQFRANIGVLAYVSDQEEARAVAAAVAAPLTAVETLPVSAPDIETLAVNGNAAALQANQDLYMTAEERALINLWLL